MQDILRNKMVYFLAIPVVLLVWSSYNSLVVLPQRHDQYQELVEQYSKSQPLIGQIIKLAPERVIQANDKDSQFDYDVAIMKTAQLCQISPSKITPNIRSKITNSRQAVHDATVSIDEIKIQQFAKFLSVSLHLWPDLQCQRLKLIRLKGDKDSWKADVSFRYFY